MFEARSGWVASTPVSRAAAVVAGRKPTISWPATATGRAGCGSLERANAVESGRAASIVMAAIRRSHRVCTVRAYPFVGIVTRDLPGSHTLHDPDPIRLR